MTPPQAEQSRLTHVEQSRPAVGALDLAADFMACSVLDPRTGKGGDLLGRGLERCAEPWTRRSNRGPQFTPFALAYGRDLNRLRIGPDAPRPFGRVRVRQRAKLAPPVRDVTQDEPFMAA